MKKTMLLPTQKIFASFASILVLFSSFTPYIQQPVYAQEATDSAQVSEVTPSPSPTILPTQMPQKEIDQVVTKEPDVKGVQTKLEASPITDVLEESAPLQTEASSRMKRATRVHDLAKKTYKQSESIVISLDKDPENDIVATMISKEGKRTEVPLIEHLKNRSSGTVAVIPAREITPGAYTLEIKDTQGETANYDILWGVLAINTNKSVYSSGEKASLAIAVLDEKGEMVCDADLKLSIKDPKGETKELTTEDGIKVTDVCSQKIFTMEPDYKAEYQVSGEGVYVMDLTAKTKNGSYTIQDQFVVKDGVPFVVERSAPTRTYPVHSYPVTLKVTAMKDFKGEVSDIVPYGFDISEQEKSSHTDDVARYDRVDTESESSVGSFGSEEVLGTSTSSISLQKPFEGNHPVTLAYGDEYHAEGLVDMISNALRLEGHEGIDFDMPKGTPVLAAAEGKIIIAGEHDYGLTVTIQHDWGKTYYGHLSEVLVKEGDEVKVGQEIAKSGSSGESTGPHLHFGVKPNGSDVGNGYQGMVDPREYLPDLQNSAVLGVTTKASSLVKEISWDVDIKKGETVRLGYQFVSPPDSPRLYLLGKARFSSDEKDIFQEERQWQVAVDVGSGGGMLAYDEDQAVNTTPHYRTWSGTDFSSEGQMTDEETSGEEANHTIIEAAPTRDEYIRGALTSSGHLDIQVWDGDSWIDGSNAPTNGEFTTAIGTTNDVYRGFDIAYEDSTGDALVVYESTSTADGHLKYRTWDGSAWSSEGDIDYTAVDEGNDVALWIELESDFGSDNILLGWQESAGDGIYGSQWTGSTFQNTALINGGGSAQVYQNFDVAWEGSSGDGMIAYGLAASPWIDAKTYTTGGGWADTVASGPGTATNTWVRIAGSPNNDYIALTYTENISTTSSDFGVDMWNGSNFTTIGVPTEDADIDTWGFSQGSDVVWEIGSSSDRALFVWRDSPTSSTSLRYMIFDISVGQFLAIDDDGAGTGICNLTGTATNQQVTALGNAENSNGPCTGLGAWTNVVSGVDLEADPESRKIMVLAQDLTADLTPEAQMWNGADAGTWLTQTSNMSFETDASTGVTLSASLPTKPYDFAYNRYAPTINISGTCDQYDQSTDCSDDGAGHEIKVAYDGVAQATVDGTVDGSWQITGIIAPTSGQVVTVYINGESTASERAVSVTKYDGAGDITGIKLYQRHLTLGSDDTGVTISNANLANWDNGASGDADIFYEVDSNDDLNVDTGAAYSDEKLYLNGSDTYQPGTGNSSNVTTHDLVISSGATFDMTANTVTVSGSWTNSGTFSDTCSGSFGQVNFMSGSSGETLSGTLDSSSAFCKVNFNGSGGGWTIQNPITFTAANATDTLQVTAGTVTLGDGTGDNMLVDGKFTISSGAVFQTYQNLAVTEAITMDINTTSSPATNGCPSTSANCIIAVSGKLDIGRRVTVNLNSVAALTTTAGVGIEVAASGYLEVKGSEIDTGTDTGTDDSTFRETKICANESYANDDHNGRAIRMVDGLARGRIYTIADTIASDGDCATGTDDSLVRTTTASSTDTNPTVSCSGNKCVLTLSTEGIVGANNDFIGQYIHDITGTEGYYLIVDSNETSTDTITVIGDPSTLAVASGDDVFVSDGVRSGDAYQILDFATITSNTSFHGYIHHASGAESVIKYAEISEMGENPDVVNKYGLNYQSITGTNSLEGASISYSYIHDSHRSIRFDSASHINRSYTVQGESQGIMYNYIKDATSDGINASSGNSADIIGNRIQVISGNKDCLVVWTGAKNLIVDNILTTCDPGIYMDTSGGNYVVNNKVYNSTGYGIAMLGASSKNLLVSNSVFSTAGAGIINTAAGGPTVSTNQLVGNTVDVSATYGLSQENDTASTIIGVNELYGTYVGNTTADVNHLAGAAHKSRFYNSKFGSSTEVSVSTANSFVASFKHDQTSGATSMWNDFIVPTEVAETPLTEGTAKFNYADALWDDNFTPSMITGSGTADNLDYSFSGGTLGGSANQYAYAARCKQTDCSTTTSAAWDVYRDGVDIGDADTATQFTDATTNVRFKIDDNGTNYARGDLYLFAAYQDSGDSNTQKTLTMMQDADTFTVGTDEAVELKGQSTDTNVTQVTRSAGGYKFTIQSGGAIDASSYAFDYMGGTGQTIGLELQTGATVTNLDNGNFDNFVTDGTNTTYISVASGIIDGGSQTWDDMTFDDTTGFADFNVTLSGTPAACSTQWSFYGAGTLGGATNGEANDSDTDGSCSGVGYLKWFDPVTGPTLDQVMRHGKWFSSGVEQGFTF